MMLFQTHIPFLGFERLPKGRLLSQIVDFDDPFGVAYERCIGYFKDFHMHDRVNLTFPRAASVIEFSTRNPTNKFVVDSRSLLWMPPLVEHSQNTRSTIYDNLAIFPTKKAILQTLKSFENRYGIIPDLPQRTIKKPRSILLDELLNEFFAERILERKSPKKLTNLAQQIVEEAMRISISLSQLGTNPSPKHVDLDYQNDHKIIRAIRFIESNLFEDLSIKEIGEYAGLSTATLFRKFSDEIGLTPGEYITTRRLDESLSLLKSGKHTISDIAVIIGYSDLAAFSKAFKKKFGKSPRSYGRNLSLE